MADSKKSNWFWPVIEDRGSARSAARSGMWAALIVALVTALVATVAMSMGSAIQGIDAWAYLDAGIFAIIAFFTWRMSRVAAVIGLLLFIVERIDMYLTAHAFSLLSILILLMFINGVRGTFGYRRFGEEAPEAADA